MGGWELVGRERELEALGRALDGGGALVVGPAGVGKTRLVEAALARRDHDWVRALPQLREIPLGALLPAVADTDAIGFDELRTAFLRRRVAPVLVVDDAPWLDDASAAVVHQLLESGTTVVMTARDDLPLPEPLASRWRTGAIETITLGPLELDGCRRLAGAIVGGEVDDGSAARLAQSTAGNPLFLSLSVLDAVANGALTASEGLWHLAEDHAPGTRVRDVVGRRLTALEPIDRRLLEAVAMAEPVPEAALLATEPDAVAARDALARLIDHGIVVGDREPGAPPSLSYRVAHPIYGEVVRSSLTATARRDVYRRLSAIPADAPTSTDPLAIRRVVWRVEGALPVDPEAAVAAANRLNARYSHVEAAAVADAAMTSGGGAPAAIAAAAARQALGDEVAAAAILEAAAASASTDWERAHVTDLRVRTLHAGLGRRDEARAVCRAALEVVTDTDARDFIVAVDAATEMTTGDAAAALAAVEPLLLRSDVAPLVVLRATPTAGLALALAGRGEAAIALAERALPLAFRHGDELPRAIGWAVSAQILGLAAAARLDDADALLAALYDLSVEQGITDQRGAVCTMQGTMALIRGLVPTAVRRLREGERALRERDVDHMLPWCLANLAEALSMAGDAAGAVSAAQEARRTLGNVRSHETQVELASALAVAASSPELGRRQAVAAARRADELGQHWVASFAWYHAGRIGAIDEAASGLRASPDPSPYTPVLRQHAEARAAADGAGLEAAAAGLAGIGARLYAAEAESQAAAVFRRAGLRDRAARASARAGALLESCGVTTSHALEREGPWPTLTERERQVVDLAASGASNRSIAERLGLSVRTVESHLYKAYTKLGVTDRADLRDVVATR